MTFQGRVYEKGIIDKGYEKEVLETGIKKWLKWEKRPMNVPDSYENYESYENGYQKGVLRKWEKNIRTYHRAIKTIWYFKNNSFNHFWGLQLT